LFPFRREETQTIIEWYWALSFFYYNFLSQKQRDKAGLTPLHYAATAGQFHCCISLLRAGARFLIFWSLSPCVGGTRACCMAAFYFSLFVRGDLSQCFQVWHPCGARAHTHTHTHTHSIWSKSINGISPEQAARGQGHRALANGLAEIASFRDLGDTKVAI
jgi:ankyrin repeat protein